jgi:hypothetical protein
MFVRSSARIRPRHMRYRTRQLRGGSAACYGTRPTRDSEWKEQNPAQARVRLSPHQREALREARVNERFSQTMNYVREDF